MANGKPGDHPITDVMVHNSVVFGDPWVAWVRAGARLVQHGMLVEGGSRDTPRHFQEAHRSSSRSARSRLGTAGLASLSHDLLSFARASLWLDRGLSFPLDLGI